MGQLGQLVVGRPHLKAPVEVFGAPGFGVGGHLHHRPEGRIEHPPAGEAHDDEKHRCEGDGAQERGILRAVIRTSRQRRHDGPDARSLIVEGDSVQADLVFGQFDKLGFFSVQLTSRLRHSLIDRRAGDSHAAHEHPYLRTQFLHAASRSRQAHLPPGDADASAGIGGQSLQALVDVGIQACGQKEVEDHGHADQGHGYCGEHRQQQTVAHSHA